MFKREITPLSESMMNAIDQTINKMEHLGESVAFNGHTFKNYKTFNSEKAANDFLEKNDGYGVIGEKGGKVYVAKNSDKGVNEGLDLDEARRRKSTPMQSKPTGFRTYDKVTVNGKTGYVRKVNDETETAQVEFGKGDMKSVAFEDMKLVKTAGGVKNESVDLGEKYAKATSKSDDGEGMDPVGKEDGDIDNDGDTDSSDEYLNARRKAIGKAMKKRKMAEEFDLEEAKGPDIDSMIQKGKWVNPNTPPKELFDALGVGRNDVRVMYVKIGSRNKIALWFKNVKTPSAKKIANMLNVNSRSVRSVRGKIYVFIDEYLETILRNISMKKRKMDEEVEQIDELSKKTLRSYVKKASKNLAHHDRELDRAHRADNPDAREYHAGMAGAREMGISKAKRRLAREEVDQLDEISKNMVKAYRDKSADEFRRIQSSGGKMTDKQKRRYTTGSDAGINSFNKLTGRARVNATEEFELDEAKMSDTEILNAAKKLAANGKDAKTKAFGKGLVDFYKKNDSFTPDQVAGLQNIMKNASFQMAKDD